MIFRIKHHWVATLAVTLAGALLGYLLGGWERLFVPHLSIAQQIALGIAGTIAALAINFTLHTLLQRTMGTRYLAAFERYGNVVLDDMRWPHYLTGGLMAAVAEEPLFRGVLVGAIDQPIAAIIIAAVVFALCHWLRKEFWPFWFWAMWEGVLFGILFVVTGSLLVPMIAHGLHDVLAYRVFQSLLKAEVRTQRSEVRDQRSMFR